MGGDRVALWIHGHTHDPFDYEVDGTRVVCKPARLCAPCSDAGIQAGSGG